MGRSRCAPFDAATIRAAIASGATSERAAYIEYANCAGRPYARSTFSLMLRAKASTTPSPPKAELLSKPRTEPVSVDNHSTHRRF